MVNHYLRRSSLSVLVACLSFALPSLFPVAWAADPLPSPQGPVIVVIAGNIEVANTGDTASFDRPMVEALEQAKITTTTPWTDGKQVFTGVLARTILQRVGASGTTVKATALNDYTVEIPFSDFMTYDVLLATHANGQQMQVSDKGPVWIVYPRDDVPALNTRSMHDRWVWQLKSLTVQ